MEELYALREKAKTDGEPILRDASFEVLIEKIKAVKPKRILEVGVNVGLSGIAMMLNSPKSTYTGIEIDEEKANTALKNFKAFNLHNRAKIFIADAIEIIPILTGNYDFIFLDGPKGHYYEFLPYLLEALEVGGVIFADNVLFRGYVDGRVKTPRRFTTARNSMKKYLDAVSNDERLKTEIIDLEDGISITERIK